MTDARTHKGWITWFWLLIVTIGVHALVPVGSPLVRSTGSPFSASTVDVSTAPSRRQVQVEHEEHDGRLDAATTGFDGPGPVTLSSTILAPAVPSLPHRAIPRERAAPAVSPAAGPPRARAPPTS